MPLEPSDAQLDALILASASLSWLKVESLVVRVGELCEEQNLRFDPDVVASRIAMLVHGDDLEGAGDLSRWRHSEVRLARVADPPS
jgi:hypothetical protein